MPDSTPFPFIFISHSEDKVADVERLFGLPLERRSIELPEIQAVEVERVVGLKAEIAYRRLGNTPVMVEDTGLYFEAWNGLPGALITWFLERVGPDGICQMMSSFTDRRAYAESIVATYDGQLRLFRGRTEGQVAARPAGDRGFGWDSIFIPGDTGRTFAQMTAGEHDSYSMRRLALEALRVSYDLDGGKGSNV